MNELLNSLTRAAQETNIPLSNHHLQLFEQYYQCLLEGNQKFNLTAITEPLEVAVKHFIDSLTCLTAVNFPQAARLLDVGTGAGFPGLPIKIYRPDLNVTLMDSLNKRIVFLKETLNTLGLSNIQAVHDRAEDFGRRPADRENYDIVVSRAVARLAVLAEYCLPCVKPGGYFISQKGPDIEQEVQEAARAIKILGGQLTEVKKIQLPLIGDGRSLVVIKKIQPTPATYPRKAGLPAKKPIL
ncbi:16S rRNA (guanine(527)-N(7))-methyltransferase RsmG [Desulforamulus hydrothermalis]|uniref:Ribosomal RNA small subunit methyltransferase G n=1 Tax=Desulforamulus hydrothermalis Lam5 = DSM 18033 TaxID=1121428 RepID=K8E9R1_9FIRM|nr:16S rRNA (guanine(527)-N(7))-methyltransferase RsmG [Desulforamulus hydrothermalis]CCO08323.1 Ribosomal RNA small subunit methyltransferase G [Desulforamulus hydrothermalis Lam5 = DSM 18033]SHH47050.1 16S rRNA m(7)G-527 methyltransferase [Desulforamulus hydrothermalis Lam5 = DSM 18033]